MKKPGRTDGAVDVGRRRISVAAAMALLGGATVALTACGGGASPTAPPTPSPTPTPDASGCPANAACGAVSVDPAHAAVITEAQLAAGGALVLNIQGRQNHGHVVELTADEVVAIRNRQRVDKTSSRTLNHEHSVTFN